MTYLTYSASLLEEHRSSTVAFHSLRSLAFFLAASQFRRWTLVRLWRFASRFPLGVLFSSFPAGSTLEPVV